MSQTAAVLAALGASASAAVAAVLQSRSAGNLERAGIGQLGGVLRFARSQLSHPFWWVSLCVQVIGFGLHALALSLGALVLVQPLMASAVVLAVPLNHRVSQTAVTVRELAWAVCLSAGLSGFLVASQAGLRPTFVPSVGGAGAAAVVAFAIVGGCVVVSGRFGRNHAAALLGTAAATSFAAEAALLQHAVAFAATDPVRRLTGGAGYALALAGAAGVALTQLAYRAGPMSAALPAIVTINPLLSILYGTLVQREPFRTSLWAIALELLSFALLVTGAIALTRRVPAPRSPARTRTRSPE